jgi:hypothetical protein
MTSAFACLAATDDLYLSAKVWVDPHRVFYLTVNVESFKGPGHYNQAQLYAQLAGSAGVQRWSQRAAAVDVHADHSVRVPAAQLDAEPGTGSTGIITISGDAGCT